MAIRSLKSGLITRSAHAGNTITYPGSYEQIATATGTGASGTITFTNIPSTYSHLQLRSISKGDSTAGGFITSIWFRLNGDATLTNYWNHSFYGNGTNAGASNGNTNADFMWAVGSYTGYANKYVASIIDIPDYANTSKLKTMHNLEGLDSNSAANGRISLKSMTWNNTAAISSITIVADPTYIGNWTTSSHFALYGIK